MSVQDLKARAGDVPGIQNLTMQIVSGRMTLAWGNGYAASVDVTASDAECEAAVRNAAKLPPVILIPDKPAPAPTGQPAAQGTTMSGTPADTMNALDGIMRDHVRLMSDIHETQKRLLESSLARQRDTVAQGIGSVAARIDQQTDDFNAMMARWTNGAPV